MGFEAVSKFYLHSSIEASGIQFTFKYLNNTVLSKLLSKRQYHKVINRNFDVVSQILVFMMRFKLSASGDNDLQLITAMDVTTEASTTARSSTEIGTTPVASTTGIYFKERILLNYYCTTYTKIVDFVKGAESNNFK